MRASELQLMVKPPCWQTQPADLAVCIAELRALSPEGSILCLEGVIAEDIESFLKARPSTFENETDQGFLKIRPKVYFTPITVESLFGLASLAEKQAEPEVCDGLRVYEGERLILSWPDVPFDPIYIASTIPEVAVSRFCKSVGSQYVFCSAACQPS